jgi:glutamyl-tRNA reductase
MDAMTIARDDRAARLPQLAVALGVRELVYVATCNRVEVTFAGDGRVPIAAYRRRVFSALTAREPVAAEAEHALRAWHGEGAVEHLLLVAAGLDSARVGEQEITAQLHDAVALSRSLGLIGPGLEPPLTEAFRVAKRVRPLTEGKVGKVSLAQVAARLVRSHLGERRATVALVGLSPMTMQCAEDFRAAGFPLLVVNRTAARGHEYAATLGARFQSLDDFRAAPEPVAAVVLATGAPEPVLRCGELERLASRAPDGQSPLIVDLGVPPNVAAADALAADVPRLGMDDVTAAASQDRDEVLMEFSDARALVDDALTELRRHTADRLVGPMIAELRLRYRHTAVEGVDRLFKKELSGLGAAEREAVVRWAETLSRRFAHLPAVGLRELAFRAGPSAVEAFFDGVDPTLARALHDAVELSGSDASFDADVEYR